MNIITIRCPQHLLAALLFFGGGAYALAQAAPSTADTKKHDPSDDESVELSPFVVTSTAAEDGYKVRDTLGGTRVRTDLSDVASSISVVSKKLLDDTGITNAQQLLVYTTNTEVAGLNGNYSGVSSRGSGVQGNAEASRLANPNSINRARGLTPMDNTRNYYLSDIPWDSFNIDRVDISRGPNSFLFGVGSPSGIQNYSTNEAVFVDKGSVEARYGSYSTVRESLDYNKVLLPGQLAARIDLLNDDTKFRQKPAYNHSERLYAALRFDPKFLNSAFAHTTIKANMEFGRVRSNNPRELPPMDYISGYFDGAVNKGGYDPFVYNTGKQLTGIGSFSGLSPWVNGTDIHYAWPGPAAAYWYNGATGGLDSALTTLNGTNNAPSGLTVMKQASPLYISGFSNYARTVNSRDSSMYPGAASGTVTYSDKSLTDSSIFNFYDKLIDGDNKREWQNWHTLNLVVDQSLFNGRLSFQGTYDHQDFDFGNEGLLSGYMQPYISVDMDAYKIIYPSALTSMAVANPNVGRPFIASDFGAGNSSTHNIHNNLQLLANFDVRASDFVERQSTLDKIIGTHSFTGLVGDYRTKTETRNWSMYATDVAFANAMGDSSGLISANRTISWAAYLGNSLTNKSSASGLDLSNLATKIQPTSGSILHFNNTWTGAVNSDKTAPWTYPGDPTGTYTQADNPANYVGWKTIPVNVLSSKDDISDLYQSGTKSLQKLRSYAFMYQGKMLDGVLVPMFGWRKDEVKQSSSNAPLDPMTHVANMNYTITGDDAVVNTHSSSTGVTVHLPKQLRDQLPLDTDLSLHYFHGENGTPKVRYGFDANQLPNEAGKTDDVGFRIDTLKGRLSFTVTYFKTIDKNAQATSGAADPLGGNGYYLYLLPAWGAADAATSGMYLDNGGKSVPSSNGFDNDGTSGALDAARAAAVADWKANFAKYFPQSFFNSYGLGVNVNAITTGNWANVYNNSSIYPYPWVIANTGSGKVNGSYPIISQDVESKGWEMEATLRPVDNWDITVNGSKVNAVQTALGASTVSFIQSQYAFFKGAAGTLPLWGYWGSAPSSTGTLNSYFMQNIYSAYLLQTAQTGSAQPELRNWSAKAITNYTFASGLLKGVNVGGGYRWASKPILGYGISQTTDSQGNALWIMDVHKPLYGRADEHFDLWVGYKRKVSAKIDWHVQLNVQNAFERARLAPVSVEPNGDVAQWRIMQGQTFTLTNTFTF